MQDIIIIGAGIIGSMLARTLSQYNLSISVVDRQRDVANETTMANSAIIHTGYDPEDGTLKAKLNVRGSRMYEELCAQLGVDYQKCGALILANKNEFEALRELKARGEKRGIQMDIVNRDEILTKEPHVADTIMHALSVPDTAIVYPWQLALACMEEAVMNGTRLYLHSVVEKIRKLDNGYEVVCDNQTLQARVVLNAAGCGAEQIAAMIEEPNFHISLRRGEYFVLSKNAKTFVSQILYPVPSKKGKGVLCVPTTHGNILLGPNSEESNCFDTATTLQGMDTVRENLAMIVKDVPYNEIIHSFSGIRASGNKGDFYIKESKLHKNFIHIACIDSPGLASAPAIADYVIQELLTESKQWNKKATWHRRKKPVVMNELSIEEKNERINKYPLYGNIICRCEKISYQEVVNAIHSSIPATSLKAIKKRVRPGMGRCQGGFCEVEVAKILSKELDIPLSNILYDELNSDLGEVAK